MIENKNIPIYDLESDYKINIEFISHDNHYDFNEIHKHNYFEILFFERGGGYQKIDFTTIPIKDFSCYIVKPGQLHLVRRDVNADGLLIQFTETMVLPDVFVNSLSILKLHLGSEILFEKNEEVIKQFLNLLNSIQLFQENKTLFFKQKTIHLLSNLLYTLEEFTIQQKGKIRANDGNILISRFIDLVERYLNKLSVNEYAEKLNISPKKLTGIIKEEFNSTPLKYIHRIVLLNIKRDLVFKTLSHKEIAYNYNFDSPSNYSIFIKKQTGKTPTQLQEFLHNN